MLLKIDRYVGRAFIVSYAICLVGVISLYIVLDVFGRLDDFMDTSNPLRTVFAYYVLTTPITFLQVSHFFPVMAALFAITRLQRSNEFTPIKASGISLYRAMLPIFVLSAIASVLSVANQELVVPYIGDGVARVQRKVQGDRDVEQVLLLDSYGQSLFVQNYDALNQTMKAVNFAGFYPNGRIKTDYIAREGEWVGTSRRPIWRLKDVTYYRYDEKTGEPLDDNGDMVKDYPKYFKFMEIKTSLTPSDLERKELHNDFLTFADLRQRSKQYKQPQIRIQVHQRFTTPLGAIVLLLLGVPLVLYQESKSVFLGVIICVAVCGTFFLTTFIFQDLGNKRFLQPIIASWSPIVIFGSAGVCMFFTAIRT